MRIKSHSIKLIYITDPNCEVSWRIEPFLNALLQNYKSLITFECKMGGITGSKNTVKSSYSASVAYYAARNQNIKKAYHFLRAIRESKYFQNKDISEETVLVTAAINCDLNLNQFLEDIKNGKSKLEFEKDLSEKEKWNVTRFPTLIFSNDDGEFIIDNEFLINNSYDNVYKNWELILEKLTKHSVLKTFKKHDVLQLLEKHKVMSLNELIILSGKPKNIIEKQLNTAFEKGKIIKENNKQQTYWRYNKTDFQLKKLNSKLKKISIIGGGISGYAMALNLKKIGVNPIIYERNKEQTDRGFGFLILKNGIDALESFGLKNELLNKGNSINIFKAIKPNGKIIYSKILDNCVAISRENLLNIIKNEIGNINTHYTKVFSEALINKDGKIEGIKFEDGTTVKSDIIIGCDGLKSKIRTQLFKDPKISPVGEREIVCLVNMPEVKMKKDEFLKVLDVEQGKSIGLIPIGENLYVWFLQFNQQTHPIENNKPDTLKKYALETTKNYPSVFKKAIEKSEFDKSFLWISERMDLLDSFHVDNVVLVGDAAHPLLALTSQGANSALEDAACLSSLLSKQKTDETIENIFKKYYNIRKKTIQHYIKEGDELVNYFLTLNKNKSFKLPLSLH